MIPITTLPIDSAELCEFIPARLTGRRDTLDSLFHLRFGLTNVLFLNSGRAALSVALKHVQKVSNKVLLPAFTCPVLFETIQSAGLTPLPIDVEYETLDFGNGLAEKAESDIAGVIAVHLFGDPVHVSETRQIIGDKPLLIEDCAQSLGAVVDSSPVGSEGDFSIFSFGIGKTITGGIGGALASQTSLSPRIVKQERATDGVVALLNLFSMWLGANPEAYSIAYPFLNFFRERKNQSQTRRVLSSTPIQIQPRQLPEASRRVLVSQLKKLDKIIDERRRHARILTELLHDGQAEFGLSRQASEGSSSFTRYVIRVPSYSRFAIRNALLKNGFESEAPYEGLLRLLPSYGEFPNALRLLGESLTLPIHGKISDDDLHLISNVVCRVR